ncbi:MAG: hypothetical protein AAF439_02230 [Pseudomonadota bacterium]
MRSCVFQSQTYACIFVRSGGKVNQIEWRALINRVMTLDMYQSGVPILHDLNPANFTVSTQDAIATGRTDVVPTSIARKVAMVCESDIGFGIINVVARFRNRPMHDTRVFRSFAQAAEWLERPEFNRGIPESVSATMNRHIVLQQNPDSTSIVVLRDDH